MAIQLDLSSLDKALQRLSEALQAYALDANNSLYRGASIRRFAGLLKDIEYELNEDRH